MSAKLYLITGVVMILIIYMLAQVAYKSYTMYEKHANIAVKTSQGMIKMNATAIAEELAKMQAELAKHEGYERTGKFEIQINNVLDQVKEFIRKNPKDKSLCNANTKASIVDKALADRVTPNQKGQHMAYAAILETDGLETDELKFDYLLKHIDVLILLLRNDICDNGVIDLQALEDLLRELDADITEGVTYDSSDPMFKSDDNGDIVLTRHDPYIIPRLSLFASQPGQLEGMSVENGIRSYPVHENKHFSLGPQTIRNFQQRSQMFRVNQQVLGSKQYVDEDLLLKPTYEEVAL